MNEEHYRKIVDSLFEEANARVVTLTDYVLSQPLRKLAIREVKSLVWWALTEGARNREAILERERRVELAKKNRTTHK